MTKLLQIITKWLDTAKDNFYLLGSIIGLILTIYGLIVDFKVNIEGYFWLIPLGTVFWLVGLWHLFRTKTIFAFILLTIISVMGGLLIWVTWQQQIKINDNKLIILVAEFDGPEEVFAIRNEIIEQLNNDTQGFDDIEIIVASQKISPEQGSQGAIQLGEKENADLVIWGWYRPTENPNITIHFENLSPAKLPIQDANATYRPQAVLSDLESFAIQTKIGDETSSLVIFLTGYMRYQQRDCIKAINLFSRVINQMDQTSPLIDIAKLYFYRGSCYNDLAEYSLAIFDFSEAIQINPSFSNAYLGRGVTLSNLGQYDRAIQDYNISIGIDPKFANAYLNRGLALYALGKFENAIVDFTKAIEITPEYSDAYLGRGITYSGMKQFDRAIQDFSQAIMINPNNSLAYLNRAETYQAIGKTAEAESDFKRYEELTGKKP